MRLARDGLEWIGAAFPNLIFRVAEQAVILHLAERHLAVEPVSLKELQALFQGARSSFQEFVRRLSDAGAIDLAENPADRRSKLVDFSRAASLRLYDAIGTSVRPATGRAGAVPAEALRSERLPLDSLAGDLGVLGQALALWSGWRTAGPLPTLAEDRLATIRSVMANHGLDLVVLPSAITEEAIIHRDGPPGSAGQHARSERLADLADDVLRRLLREEYGAVQAIGLPSLHLLGSRAAAAPGAWSRRLILPFGADCHCVDRLLVCMEAQSDRPAQRPLHAMVPR